jgi:hypothetical protein
MRREPDSNNGARIDPGSRRPQSVAGASGRAEISAQCPRNSHRARAIRPAAVALADPGVSDDFPATIPVSERELEVIETYLGELLDDALGRPQ